ncbi:MAG: response regulator transcription factor [Solirubrobacteraceae bacterium]
MSIEIASATRRIQWDDAETLRRDDAALAERIADAIARAAEYVDVDPDPRRGSPADQPDLAETVLPATVDELRGVLESPSGLERDELLEVSRLALELQDLGRRHGERMIGRRLRTLNAIQDSLARPQGDATVERILEREAIEACHRCGFDRAMLFRVDGSRLSALSTYFRDDPSWAAECHAVAAAYPVPLKSGLLESEMLRRRSAALMLDPMDDPRSYKPIIDKIETSGYVAVPIMPEGKVIATIHADRHFSGRKVDALDRDLLAAFAAALGSMVERKVLVDRLVAQRDHVRSMMQATDDFVSAFCQSEIGLDPPQVPTAAPSPRPMPRAMESAIRVQESPAERLLSRREMEVLRLMAGGATNAMIADQLVLAEGTVKSHVKRILRKLHAANRAEAVSRFLRLEGGLRAADEAVDGLFD